MRKSSELQGYEHRRENKLMQYFNAVGIEETGQFIHLRVYQIHRLDFVKTERTYNLGNVIKKSKNNYWIVRDSTIGLTGSSCENFEVAKLNCPLLPEDESGFRTLEEALESYERSTVTVKVAQVSPVKYRDNFLAIRSLSAKDSSNKTVKIDLFGNHAEKNYAKNDVVKLTSVYKKVYRNRIQLSLSKTSDVQFMPPESLQIAIGDDDYLSDSDFEDTPLDTFKITECLGCHIYNCCDKPACYEKKLNDDGTCRTCAERPERQMKTCRATFKYLTEASRSPIQITLFKPTLSILLQENVDLTSWDTFETQIANALPICFKCKISEGKFYNITMQ
ncbi:uncharacterized protein LOC135463899 [Liolophura sinensis]|uniref:uncharacterized protein LOC135463899 n=1 Tax=Liolophura sinensis TaxID=3198878 RepID=UPI003158FBBA